MDISQLILFVRTLEEGDPVTYGEALRNASRRDTSGLLLLQAPRGAARVPMACGGTPTKLARERFGRPAIEHARARGC